MQYICVGVFLCAFVKFIQFLLINLVLSVEKEKGIPFFLV
ncbi:hypothetical protein APT_01850 [Acetobacter pasteurianus NBRC 101655]|uniref:Uncharacterized protein n=1 Tax=Acetobacter pasteurianus (strain NBRC 105184 / IFO 3283-01) TaxID=634452 RepID=C7JC58_ACEP3|nr:hypothetical protein APA01_17580 [Acetobacter pasteurianus IFO 3283-01]BAI02939.1 hypothetical protein APA03_17580 [Acetobacter pasteurianus IFO 3283-03]BAI05985.1 hypothetical protein APA07_17580 [Acetobacter pasteurianus IFO 3283-07]BAI09034.1 hypothetical protein APA22_17580 [Acetobacter pasteurianus IFO 3283-22]BAI12082.1 hypothetical protein APA26_17580 [Acetobacter pasteurianus IFO 3283-26]BAI15128.1 hypothetical protein APA32_17580 [Acetobacter pasteurianus IFO 3283-32]BAI18108.1 hy